MQEEIQKLKEKLGIKENKIKKQLSFAVLVWTGIMAVLLFAYSIFMYQLFFILGILYTILAVLLFLSLFLLIYIWEIGLYLFTAITVIMLISFLIEFINIYPYLVGDPNASGMGVGTVALFLLLFMFSISVLGLIISYILWKNHKENLIN